jgi:hypothetical protein
MAGIVDWDNGKYFGIVIPGIVNLMYYAMWDECWNVGCGSVLCVFVSGRRRDNT